ncbi:MAG: 2Fe-2S iron-sulfur cluster-binding protein, partial [Bacteroidota bacterium]
MLSFQLNDEERLRQEKIDPAEGYHPNTTVLEYVRQIGLTGTKEGCAEGDCGACTVAVGEIVNGKMQYKACTSCLLFLPKLQGKHLVTVEGLASEGQLHPVQEAMVDHDGSQCGYCTPGIIMSLFVMYQEMGSAEPDYLDALTGNLCRCTGYRSIKDAAIQIGRSKTNGNQDQLADAKDQLFSIKPTNGVSHLLSAKGYLIPKTIGEA